MGARACEQVCVCVRIAQTLGISVCVSVSMRLRVAVECVDKRAEHVCTHENIGRRRRRRDVRGGKRLLVWVQRRIRAFAYALAVRTFTTPR